MKQNLTTLKEMQGLLNRGGALIWIAPAGGRDRRKPDGTLIPDEFDPQAVEMMRKLGTKKTSAKTHFYPLAMVQHNCLFYLWFTTTLQLLGYLRHHAPTGDNRKRTG